VTCFFQQSTGNSSRNGRFIVKGYAGKGPGKFNPNMEGTPDVGPLPRAEYVITWHPFHHPHTGGCSIRLQLDPKNNMFDRSGFLIHGDSVKHPGQASNGCIILPLPVRQQIWSSGDNQVEVVG
jgi:hypothetical protein